MVTVELLDTKLDIDEIEFIKLKNAGVLEIEKEVDPLLIEHTIYKLNVRKLINRFFSQTNENKKLVEKFINYDGLFSEYKILNIIKQYETASPKLIHSKLRTISKPTISRILSKLLEKGFIKKIETGLYKLNEKGRNLIT
ncbi:MAG: MarR family transcriptional regulator [Candidatus Helarchaeota archaeon]